MSDTNTQSRTHSLGGTLAKKLLMPLVATTVSAAASYVAKKAPQVFEERVLPRLREARAGSGGMSDALPSQVRSRAGSALSGAGDLAEGLADRAKAATGGAKPAENGKGDTHRSRQALTAEQRERRRDERAKRRDARRQATTT